MATGTDTRSNDQQKEAGVKELEQEVTCPICHNYFDDPKLLPCCHYYCKKCIQALFNRVGPNKPFPCPECRSDTILPQNDPNQLQTAFFMNRMKAVHAKLEKVSGKVEARCEMCSGNVATAFCRHCMQFICAECVNVHQRVRMFASHKVSTLRELKEGGAKDTVAEKPTLPSTARPTMK